ncbi:TetR/AcrR family transcriptional regulator C-terminal domain-containing protein [Nocardioides sp. IC4_145]|uniref:TetR/AcrR family transcriptional regulator C-terminal domain-containing protein n=1 Tax=Nocardioides sp. IC4_145 TaxID=2714037 RepID=UPI001A98DC6C
MSEDDGYVDGDARVLEGGEGSMQRPGLSRERIVVAAVEFIDDSGLPGLTMRKLGQQLGVEAMSLYRYVPSREDLLDEVVAWVMGEMEDDPDVVSSPVNGWQDFLQRLAHAVRRVAVKHPRVFPLVASRPVEAPWLRPPLRSLSWVERFLDALLDEGFDDDGAVGAYRAFSSFLLGHLLLEVAVHGADVGPLDVVEEDPGERNLAEYPTVERLRPALSDDQSAIEFEDALEELLRRLELIRTGVG